MSEVVIRVENLYKEYRLGTISHGTLYRDLQSWWANLRGKEDPNSLVSSSYSEKATDTNKRFYALKDVSFDVKQGEIVGIIGRNGAGKSTLLKVLSKVTAPTKGTVKVKGRIASLLEVGTGFHPELTGRENIYLNGTILGMKRKEIDEKFKEIVDFAEIEEFVDTPVKRYSSGMYVRLAFAVAAHLEPEILLVDEVLAVGDVAFQKKCLGKMGEIAEGGRTVLFVSHNMSAIENMCPTTHLLDQGHIVLSGLTEQVINRYLQSANSSPDASLPELIYRDGSGQMRFTDIVVRDASGNPTNVVLSGQDVIISLYYTAREEKPLKNVSIVIGFHNLLGQFLFLCGNEMVGNYFEIIPFRGCINCHIPSIPLPSGSYGFNFHCSVNGIMADFVEQYIQFVVNEGDFFGTGRMPPSSHKGLLVNHNWSIESDPSNGNIL